ncbi:MAG: hypothetical protein HGB33_00695 [Syntrophaceae bacterium]|nr:hypothetical protein [Syntrophaceae bacterium]NTW76301.1 hypothetical protein [Syntrophaceae bacterium]
MNNKFKIIINTELSRFVLLDGITKAGEGSITGRKHFNDPFTPALAIECLAQLGAYHVRYLVRFERHAFLLKIKSCLLPGGLLPPGDYNLSGSLQSRSTSAFTHLLRAELADKIIWEGIFLFALVDYDFSFKKEFLQEHYQRIFSCLQSGTRIN